MADLVFNNRKADFGYYCTLPATNDALVVVVLEAAGLEADATLRDYDTLAALLAGTSNEQTTMGRKTVSSGIVTTVDDVNERVDIDMADVTWVGATGAATGAIVVCYDPDTTAGDDTTLLPLTKHDFVATPAGGDIIAQIAATGFVRAS